MFAGRSGAKSNVMPMADDVRIEGVERACEWRGGEGLVGKFGRRLSRQNT